MRTYTDAIGVVYADSSERLTEVYVRLGAYELKRKTFDDFSEAIEYAHLLGRSCMYALDGCVAVLETTRELFNEHLTIS